MAVYPHLHKSHSPGAAVLSMQFSAVGEGLEAAQQLDEWLKSGFNFVFSIFLPLHCPQQLMSVLTDIVCPRNQPSAAHLSTRDATIPQQCNALVVANPAPLRFSTSGINRARNSLWNCKWEVKLSGKLSGKSDQMGRERKKKQSKNNPEPQEQKQAVQKAGCAAWTQCLLWRTGRGLADFCKHCNYRLAALNLCVLSGDFLCCVWFFTALPTSFLFPSSVAYVIFMFSPSFPYNEGNRKAVCRGRV